MKKQPVGCYSVDRFYIAGILVINIFIQKIRNFNLKSITSLILRDLSPAFRTLIIRLKSQLFFSNILKP